MKTKSVFKPGDTVLWEWGGERHLGTFRTFRRTRFSNWTSYECIVEPTSAPGKLYCLDEECIKKIVDNEMKQIEILL